MSTVLVAEEDPGIRHLVSAELHRSGFDVIETADGAEAVAAARRSHPDLVLLDLRRPRLEGLGVVRELRDDPATADLPVLVLTTGARPLDDPGVTGYIVKPFSPHELVRRIEEALSRVGRR